MVLKRPILAVAGLALCLPLAADAAWHRDGQTKMGTLVEIQLWHEDPAEARRLLEAGMAEFDRIEADMSTFREDSLISRINREAVLHPVEAGEELYRLVERSLALSRDSGGAFDITFDAVGALYDFRARVRPEAEALADSLVRVDYRHVRLDARTRSIRYTAPGTRINLGGIAKGYACERVVALLREAGVRHAMAVAGGDTRLLGDRRGRPWIVGIRDPDARDRWVTRLALADEAISTSGDYERYFDEDGERYHHILNPASGLSASGVRSVTVVGPDATLTDGLSTTLFVLGVEKGLDFIGTRPGYEAVIVDADRRVHYSSGLAPPSH